MPNNVVFKSNYAKGKFETRKISEDDFCLKPKAFQNDSDDNATVELVDQYGMLFLEGDTSSKPLYYMRHALINQGRFCGVIEPGEDFLSPQIKGDTDSFFQKAPISNQYHRLNSNNGFAYGFSADNPYMNFLFSENSELWEEGHVLELKVKHVGPAIVDHQAAFRNLPEIFLNCLIEGTYRGKKVVGMGQCAKNYKLSHQSESILNNLGYITVIMSGIRENGEFEQAFVAIDHSGTVGAYYICDGKEPVFSDEVSFEADWFHLPYVDDGTCIFGPGVIRFKDVELHFQPKWGTKGVTKLPRIEKHGQSHVFGTWYEGTEPYTHSNYFTFSENMGAYDTNLKKMGFEVK